MFCLLYDGGTCVWLHGLMGSFPHSYIILQHGYCSIIFNNWYEDDAVKNWQEGLLDQHEDVSSHAQHPNKHINWVSEAPVLERKEEKRLWDPCSLQGGYGAEKVGFTENSFLKKKKKQA